MPASEQKVLVFGYGNPGRLDDGLGPALAEAVERLGLPGVTVDADYQLVVEDAHQLAQHDVVIFADADTSGAEPFYLRVLQPEATLGFSSHSVKPGALLALAGELFGRAPRAFVLGIRGYEFNAFGEGLSARAQANLAAAVAHLERALPAREFDEVNADTEATPGVAAEEGSSSPEEGP